MPLFAWRWLGLLALAALFVAQVLVRFQSHMVNDTAWFIHAAQGLLQGKRLYVDFMEVNPPLGIWLSVPPVWLAHNLGLGPIGVYYAFIFAAIAVSLALCARYSQKFEGAVNWPFIFCLGVAELFIPAGNFAEREHLMIIMFAPWVFLRLLNREMVSAPERAAVGALAALAICLKPQAIFAPLLVEASVCLGQRNWRKAVAVENLTAVVVGLAYVASVFLFTPDYFRDMVPLGRAAYLPYYGYTWDWVLYNSYWPLALLLIAGFGWRTERSRPFIAAALGFLLSYYIQNRGFRYQAVPATAFAFLAAMAALDLRAAKQFLPPWIAGMTTFALLLLRPQINPDDAQFIRQVLRDNPNVHSLFLGSLQLRYAFPLVVEENIAWPSRYPNLWLIPYVAHHWSGGPLPDDKIVLRALHDAVDDMVQGKPDLILVDQTDYQFYVPGNTFDWLSFWNNDPRFGAYLQGYEQRPPVEGHAVFARKPAP